jgi:hypothetical protein
MSEPPNAQVHVRRIFMVLVVIACAVGIISVALLPALSGSRRSPVMRIVSNLKQIDIAKQQWAEDHRATNSTPVYPEALASYFGGQRKPGELVPPALGERYVINGVGVAPEAQLTRRLGKWPEGTIIRLHPTTNRLYEVILPGGSEGSFGR